MRLGRRVVTIYVKELIELLRDRRTLIAMIVVPITLYPLLIVGSVHLLSFRSGEQQIEPLTIAVPDESNSGDIAESGKFLSWIFDQAKRELRRQADNEGETDKLRASFESIEKMRIERVPDVREAVSAGEFLVGIELRRETIENGAFERLLVTPFYDRAEVRSESASSRVIKALELVSKLEQERILARLDISPAVLEPLRIDAVSVASPKKIGGMVLGTIVPLVLVLMTITGAIYPAIDLTAGERERGTLESLIVCPVPAVELITGKYLVVATVAMLGATLNLASVGATLYFGGVAKLLSSSGETELPLGVLPIILVALIPFALLFSAIMVAVCSYARTFKEAQNYIVPVILAALIPGGVAALPGTELSGVNAVVPVMNMVLMARELLLGNYDWGAITLVLLSTSLYAGASVIIASRIFSTETVVFADSASFRSLFRRKMMVPRALPSVSMVLLIAAVLFPVWMFVQFAVQPEEGESLLGVFKQTAGYMPIFLVLLPIALLVYFKINVARTLAIKWPAPRFLIAALLIGLAAWMPAHELFLLQGKVIPIPKQLIESNAQLVAAFDGQSLFVPLLLIAIVPAICEELFFRGLLFAGLRGSSGKWMTIIATACIFAVFHIMLIKFVLTASLGLLLGYLRWQSRSLWPSIIAHMLHNASAVLLVFVPAYPRLLGITDHEPTAHLPTMTFIAGCAVVIVAVLMILRRARRDEPAMVAAPLADR